MRFRITVNLTERESKIIALVKDDPTITTIQMSDVFGVSERIVKRYIATLKKKNILVRREG